MKWWAVGVISVALAACQCLVPVGEDAGADGGGATELCDGLDNDLNGLIDDGPDGGPLTRGGCPLTLGVWARPDLYS